MADGWLEFQAYKNEKTITSALKQGASPERLKTMIDEYEKKKQKKKNNR